MIKAIQRFLQTDLVLCSNHCWFLQTFLCVGLGSGAEDSGANSEGSLLLGIPGTECGRMGPRF